jgi:tellurite resistance-related uncharacterized protein
MLSFSLQPRFLIFEFNFLNQKILKMANQKVKEWLKSEKKDYHEGVQLYKEAKVNPKKEKFFNVEEPEQIHRNMLFSELVNWDRVYNKEKTKTEKKATEKQNPSKNLSESRQKLDEINKDIANGRMVIDKNPVVKYTELPEHLQEAYDENGKLYSEVKSLHAKLKSIPTDNKHDAGREKLITEAVEKHKTIRANWKLIDEWATKQPAPQPINPSGAFTRYEIEQIKDPAVKAVSKEKRIEANISYIRRYREDATKQKEVEKRITELEAWEIDYEKHIGTNKNS